jgi:DNA-directed RNA polymerase specialized sigma24 family protein
VPTRQRHWVLNQEAFERLLRTLDPDRERAGQEYELIRASLVRIFEVRGCAWPESLADQTIDRVSRRIAEGEQIRSADPVVYFMGVAHNVLREYWAEIRREGQVPWSQVAGPRPTDEPRASEAETSAERLDCLRHCISELPLESASLIRRYYQSEGGKKISDRAELAKSLGVSVEALRMRTQRIRQALLACVNKCMKNRAEG